MGCCIRVCSAYQVGDLRSFPDKAIDKSTCKMASAGGGGGATTTVASSGSASIRDGATPSNPCDSSPTMVVVPEWKRELLERRKNLAKTASPPTTAGEQNQHRTTATTFVVN